jgi:hypothetical protein
MCNVCHDAKGYCEKSRAKRRAEDEAAYLKRNAEAHLAWAHRNPDKVAAQQHKTRTVPERRWKEMLTSLRQKYGEAWQTRVRMEDKDALCDVMRRPCEYCGRAPRDEGEDDDVLNGLDRVDPKGIYEAANVVPSCGVCNAVKQSYSTDEFVAGVRRVVAHHGEAGMASFAPNAKPSTFGKDAARAAADDKDKTCYLTEDQKLDMWSSPCYLCGRGPSLGIDRVDATKGYVADNCRGCCTQCNYMKKDWRLEAFLGHMARIHEHTRLWVLRDASALLTTMLGERKPVAAVNDIGDAVIVFPSAPTAAAFVRQDARKFQSMIDTGHSVRGMHWTYVSPAMYNKQQMSASDAKAIIVSMRTQRDV